MTANRRDHVVVVTQAGGGGAGLQTALEQRGVRVWCIPVVAHEPGADPVAIDAALHRLTQFDWVVFTSARAVGALCDRPLWQNWPWETASRPRIGAVGAATAAALTARGLHRVLCPAQGGGARLAQAVIAAEGGTMEGRAVLWPRSAIARPELAEALRAAKAHLVDPVVYRTIAVRPPALDDLAGQLSAGRVDAVTFLSPSSAESLASMMPDGTLSSLAGRTVVASIGPTTSAALSALGAPPVVEAIDRSGSGLAAALLTHFDHHEGVMS